MSVPSAAGPEPRSRGEGALAVAPLAEFSTCTTRRFGPTIPSIQEKASSMGFLRRFLWGTTRPNVRDSVALRRTTVAADGRAVLLVGQEDLDVVGESHYQGELWRAIGRRRPSKDHVRVEVQAVLVAEPQNRYDSNAVAVQVAGDTVGYLSRSDAARYRDGLLALEQLHGRSVALQGVVAGGGLREDGYGMLGVFLRHDPADFGLQRARIWPTEKSIDTGLTAAIETDAEDDTYDLAWATNIPSDPTRAIPVLKKLINASTSPIERHFIYHHLEEALYRCRDAFPSALDEFDMCCRLHDQEIDSIRNAFMAKWERIPRLPLYAQMCIRQAKKRDYAQALRWAERGLAVYGTNAARIEWIEDLTNRAASYRAKLSPRQTEPRRRSRETARVPTSDTLVCAECGRDFERQKVRGRKPTTCPDCRSRPPAPSS